ncbi:MAG: hypothetical protein MR450_08400 [Prevotella sp.]|nr:hypothetical protein [Prevotella sp.]
MIHLKKILLLAALLTGAWNIQAEEKIEGSLAELKGKTKIKVVEDWTGTAIAGKSLEDWLLFRQTEQPNYDAKHEWEEELKPRLLEDLPRTANEKMTKTNLFLVRDVDTRFVMTIHPVSVEKKGNCIITCTIREAKTGHQLAQIVIEGNGGKFGSMSNLWGDGFRSAGKELGALMVMALKKF